MRRILAWTIVFVGLLFFVLSAVRAEDDDDDDKEDPPKNALALGFKGDWETDTGTRSFDWGPTLNLDVYSSPKWAEDRWKYGLEYSYDDESSRFVSPGNNDNSRVRIHELRYAKISFLRVRGFDFKERIHVVPYVAGGVQYVDSREDSDQDGRINRFFWAPTWGFGFEFNLNKRLTLGFDFDRNTKGGDLRTSKISIEAKFYVLGDSDHSDDD